MMDFLHAKWWLIALQTIVAIAAPAHAQTQAGQQLFLSFVILVGYLLPWGILAYYLMKSREVAA